MRSLAAKALLSNQSAALQPNQPSDSPHGTSTPQRCFVIDLEIRPSMNVLSLRLFSRESALAPPAR
jgi:hypothetical protein